MKKTFFHSLLKRFALLALAAGTVLATSVSLTACGGGGDDSNGTISYRQFVNGLKIIYLQAGSGLVLRGDPNLADSGTQPWGFAYPASLGLQVSNPGRKYQASFIGLMKPEDEDAPMKGVYEFSVGYAGNQYSSDDGFTSFLGFPASIGPDLALSGPLQLQIDFDQRMWKTRIPDGSTLKYDTSDSKRSYTFGDEGGTSTSTTVKFPQERQGFFDVLAL